MKKFHIGDILSITTDKLVSPRHMEGVYEILNFMTQDSLFTHQLPRACEECKPFLLRQYPRLRDVDASLVTPENWAAWLQEQVATFGEYLEVKQVPGVAHENIDPVSEAISMFGEERVLVAVSGKAN